MVAKRGLVMGKPWFVMVCPVERLVKTHDDNCKEQTSMILSSGDSLIDSDYLSKSTLVFFLRIKCIATLSGSNSSFDLSNLSLSRSIEFIFTLGVSVIAGYPQVNQRVNHCQALQTMVKNHCEPLINVTLHWTIIAQQIIHREKTMIDNTMTTPCNIHNLLITIIKLIIKPWYHQHCTHHSPTW